MEQQSNSHSHAPSSTEFPDSAKDAQNHILRIRESKTVGQSKVNTSDLEAALTLWVPTLPAPD